MAVEIEKKYRLPANRREELLQSLAGAGATPDGEDFEENIVYGGGVLDSLGAALRVRRTQDRTILTFKKRLPNVSDAKHQLEYESEVSSGENVNNIIRELGMEPRVIYEKRRKKWRFRSVEVVVDELPFGGFVEIEGILTAIIEAELLLGIDDLEVESKTYPSLARELGSRNGTVTESRF